MKKKILLSSAFIATLSTSSLSANNGVLSMFKDAKVTGEIRTLTSIIKEDTAQDNYATAIGGTLQYKLADYKGFGGGLSFITTNDIDALSGDDTKHNPNLSGKKEEYNQLNEAYISYSIDKLLVKFGRQFLDTPLADSDDIRMVANSFDAYTLFYEDDNFNIMLGHLKKWQGTDAGLDDDWVKTGKDGTHFIGATFKNDLLAIQGWYYNFDGSDENANNSLYIDATTNYEINKAISIDFSMQYLNQTELKNSGISSNIFGIMAESDIDNIGLSLAYNKATKKSDKHSFSGYGGGTLFTNMDTMILDEITQDRDVDAIVASVSYSFDFVDILYSYGNFSGSANSTNQKEDKTEQDLVVEYSYNDNLDIETVYIVGSDTQNLRLKVNYNF